MTRKIQLHNISWYLQGVDNLHFLNSYQHNVTWSAIILADCIVMIQIKIKTNTMFTKSGDHKHQVHLYSFYCNDNVILTYQKRVEAKHRLYDHGNIICNLKTIKNIEI